MKRILRNTMPLLAFIIVIIARDAVTEERDQNYFWQEYRGRNCRAVLEVELADHPNDPSDKLVKSIQRTMFDLEGNVLYEYRSVYLTEGIYDPDPYTFSRFKKHGVENEWFGRTLAMQRHENCIYALVDERVFQSLTIQRVTFRDGERVASSTLFRQYYSAKGLSDTEPGLGQRFHRVPKIIAGTFTDISRSQIAIGLEFKELGAVDKCFLIPVENRSPTEAESLKNRVRSVTAGSNCKYVEEYMLADDPKERSSPIVRGWDWKVIDPKGRLLAKGHRGIAGASLTLSQWMEKRRPVDVRRHEDRIYILMVTDDGRAGIEQYVLREWTRLGLSDLQLELGCDDQGIVHVARGWQNLPAGVSFQPLTSAKITDVTKAHMVVKLELEGGAVREKQIPIPPK